MATQGKSQTREQYNEYMRVYMLNRYHERRAEAVKILGGVCVVCGTSEALEIDHIDPEQKSFAIGTMWSIAKPKYLTELAKCQLLCTEHHKVKSSKHASVPHGGGVSGKRNCPCGLCKAKRREYQKNRKARLRSSVG